MGYGDIDSAVSRSQFLKYAEDLAAIYGLERQRREELKKAYQGLSDLVHAMGDGAFIANTERKIMEINQSACSLLGKTRVQTISQHVSELLRQPATGQDYSVPPLSQPVLRGEVQTITGASGKIIRLIPTMMENGWMLCLLRDVTEETRIMNLKQDFLGLLSHELRTPLTGILGFTELLIARKETITGEDAEAILHIHESGMRMFKIVEELLRFATLQNERHEIQQEPMQLSLLIHSIFEQMARQAQEKGVSLYLDHDIYSPIILRGNSAMLRELFKNVIHNAIIFGKQDGNIVVRILSTSPTEVVIEVEDDGIGIPQNMLHKVFDSFFQVEGTLSRKHQGLGLGLSIAQLIARIHGGTISLKSELDHGTTCTITLSLSHCTPQPSSKEVNA